MRILFLLTAALLAACASTEQAKLSGAMTTPLNDLNLGNAPIPSALISAQRAPYSQPPDASCTGIASELHALDDVLGPDLDVSAVDTSSNLLAQGGNAVVGMVQQTAEGIIPFRGWVRKLTGAERHSKQVTAAIAAGTVRRAYLKGMIHAKSC